MVSPEYVERLREYIAAGCAAHVRREGEDGVNAYARYTERVLSEWGLSGFAAGQISRWLRSEVKASLANQTLQRLGLLKNLSTDPETAGKLAWAWLNGDEDPKPIPQLRSVVAEPTASYTLISSAIAVVEEIRAGQYSPVQLREIAIAAIEQLAVSAEDGAKVEDSTTRESPLAWLLRDWMNKRGKTIADLAATIGSSVERAEEIMQDQPMTIPECMAVAGLTNLKPETLADWGLCPSLEASSHAEDRT